MRLKDLKLWSRLLTCIEHRSLLDATYGMLEAFDLAPSTAGQVRDIFNFSRLEVETFRKRRTGPWL